jgi:hypothetical protein
MCVRSCGAWAGGLLLGGLLGAPALAGDLFGGLFGGEDAAPAIATEPPPFPADGDLYHLEIDDAGRGLRYAVDGTHLRVTDGGVAEYVVVVESPRGARNVFFEGLRCGDDSFVTIAHGTSAQEWQMAVDPQWLSLKEDRFGFRRELARHYLCDATGNAAGVRAIRRALKGGYQKHQWLLQ